MINDQDDLTFCQDIVRRLDELKNNFRGNEESLRRANEEKSSRIMDSIFMGGIGVVAMILAIEFPATTLVAAPISALSANAAIRHGLTANLDKIIESRCYAQLKTDLGLNAPASRFSNFLHFAEENKELRQMKTLINIGRGRIGIEKISEFNREWINERKAFLARAFTPDVLPEQEETAPTEISDEASVESGVTTISYSQLVDRAQENQI